MEAIDKDYEMSQRQYLKSQEILIENLKLNIQNDENMIMIHEKSLSNNLESLNHEVGLLGKYLELYPYLIDNANAV